MQDLILVYSSRSAVNPVVQQQELHSALSSVSCRDPAYFRAMWTPAWVLLVFIAKWQHIKVQLTVYTSAIKQLRAAQSTVTTGSCE